MFIESVWWCLEQPQVSWVRVRYSQCGLSVLLALETLVDVLFAFGRN